METTAAIVNAQVEQAKRGLEALKKKKPVFEKAVLKGSPMEMLKAQQEADAKHEAAMQQYDRQVSEAEATVEAWSNVQSLMNERKRAAEEAASATETAPAEATEQAKTEQRGEAEAAAERSAEPQQPAVAETESTKQEKATPTETAEQTEENKPAAETEVGEKPKPVGKGILGDIYDQFRGKAKAAFDFLLKNKTGYLVGVFHRDEIGDIDLAYGDAPNAYKGKGLAHIIRKHVETLKDFNSVEDAIDKITDVIENGKVKKGTVPNTYDIEKGKYRVVIAADENGNWVLTAFDYINSAKEKKKGTSSTLTPSKSSDGAGAVAPNLSADKAKNNQPSLQENGEKSAEGEVETPVSENKEAENKSVADVETEAKPQSERSGDVAQPVRQELDDKRREAVESIARALGVKPTEGTTGSGVITWEDTAGYNGMYDRTDGTLHIARDAEHPLDFVFGHEGLHRVRHLGEEEYGTLKAAVRDFLGAKGWEAEKQRIRDMYAQAKAREAAQLEAEGRLTDEAKKRLDRKYDLADDVVAEEVVADTVGRMFHDLDMAQGMAERLAQTAEGRTILGKLLELVKKMIEKLRRLALPREQYRAEQLRDAFNTAFENASAKAKAARARSEAGNNERFSLRDEGIEAVNEKFNSDLEAYVNNGILPENSRFELGFPSHVLLSAGFPMLPINMRVSLLNKKAGMERHPFSPTDLYGMVNAIQKPIAIFEYSKPNMRNLIIDLTKGNKHFLVGVTLDYRKGELAVNSVSGLFPKESHEWIKWIQDGKVIRIDQKEKVLSLIDSLRTNPEEAERIGLNLDTATKVVKDFINPKVADGNVAEYKRREGECRVQQQVQN